jgi:putative two-component system response regulator
VSHMKKVLIVDDNQTNLRILEEVLAGDYRLRFANNGVEALRMASDFQPSIILLDVMMPKMDGLTVCRRLRQLPGLRDSVIIMMSAKAMPSEQAAGIDAGANAYLTKPFDEVELVALLRAHVSSSSEKSLFDAVDLREVKGLAAY